MHIAETEEQARADVAHGLPQWMDYFRRVAALPLAPEGADTVDAMIDASKDTLDKGGLAAAPAPATPAKNVEEKPAATQESNAPTFIGIDDFAKLDLRIGKVLVCEFVEGSDKLLRFELDAGELGKRQIFSGIRGSYGEPEKLVGRSVVFIANLAPRKMRFGLSEGMILSAGFDGGALALLDADSGAQPGMPVR